MAFPLSPSTGTTYTFKGVVYTWSGKSWTYQSEGISSKAPTITKTYAGPFGTERELNDLAAYILSSDEKEPSNSP